MPRLNQLSSYFLLTAGALALAACRSDKPLRNEDPELEDTLEIYSWWTEAGETEALRTLLDRYEESYPIDVSNAAERNPENARQELANRLQNNEPPDSFQAISGSDLLTFVLDDKMKPIEDLMTDNGWESVIPALVLDPLRADEAVFAVPVNIERDNTLFYNVALLDDYGIEPPATLQGFYEMCKTLQDRDPEAPAPPVDPLALPPAGWVLALVVFEAMMPGVNGGSFYLRFLKGQAQLAEGNSDREDLELLFTEFYKVVQCSNVDDGVASDSDYSRWTLHGDKVYDGEAATIVMGDWMKGYFEAGATWDGKSREPWKPNTDFGVVSAFDSADHYTFNSAVFGLPSGAPHPTAARAFLELVGSKEGQVAFNRLKGSLPARTDVDLTEFDEMVRATAEDFETAAAGQDLLLPGYASLTTFDFQNAINPALVVFALGGEKAALMLNEGMSEVVTRDEQAIMPGDVDYIVAKIIDNYPSINP